MNSLGKSLRGGLLSRLQTDGTILISFLPNAS